MNIENKCPKFPKKLEYKDKCHNKDRIEFQQFMINMDHWQCCHNCIQFDHKNNVCKLYNATPPVDVIVVGCENWQYEIPF